MMCTWGDLITGAIIGAGSFWLVGMAVDGPLWMVALGAVVGAMATVIFPDDSGWDVP